MNFAGRCTHMYDMATVLGTSSCLYTRCDPSDSVSALCFYCAKRENGVKSVIWATLNTIGLLFRGESAPVVVGFLSLMTSILTIFGVINIQFAAGRLD